jgi:hypothetical protein
MSDCDRFQLLKQEYESALREEALYQYGGAASLQQVIRYEGKAIAASTHARDRFIGHYKACPRCKTARGLSVPVGASAPSDYL